MRRERERGSSRREGGQGIRIRYRGHSIVPCVCVCMYYTQWHLIPILAVCLKPDITPGRQTQSAGRSDPLYVREFCHYSAAEKPARNPFLFPFRHSASPSFLDAPKVLYPNSEENTRKILNSTNMRFDTCIHTLLAFGPPGPAGKSSPGCNAGGYDVRGGGGGLGQPRGESWLLLSLSPLSLPSSLRPSKPR